MDERWFKAAESYPCVRGTPGRQGRAPMRRGNSIKGHTGAELGAIYPPIACTEPATARRKKKRGREGVRRRFRFGRDGAGAAAPARRRLLPALRGGDSDQGRRRRLLLASAGFRAPEQHRHAPPAAPLAGALLAGVRPVGPPVLGGAHPRRRPHRVPRRAPRQGAVVVLGAPRGHGGLALPGERRRRRRRGLPGVRAAHSGYVVRRGQLRDPHGPRHPGQAVRHGGGHRLLPHLAPVFPLPGVVPPPVRPGVRPQDVQLLRRRLLLHAAVQRPLHRHAQPGGLLLLRRLHLPGQLRRQLLLRGVPQQGHRLLRLQQRAQLLLRVRAGQRGPLRPLRRPHGPGPQQALAALPARAHPRLLLLLLPPVLLLLRLPLHRLLQPGPVLLHAHGVQHTRRLALLHQALRDDRRREAAGHLLLRVLQPAHHHRLRHGHHAPAHHRLRRPQQGGGGGHEGDQARGRLLHPRHLLRGPGVEPARPGGQHGLLRRCGA
ncbi:hypothetical protein VPH35_117939 [Triticum aestivum]